MKVVRVHDAMRVLSTRPVVRMLDKAFDDPRFPSAADAAVWLIQNIADERVWWGIAISEEGELGGFLLGMDRPSAFWPAPSVTHLHAPKSEDARRELTHAFVAWLRGRGQDRVLAVNQSGIPDDKYAALFADLAECEPLGSLLEFTFGPGEEESDPDPEE